MRPCLSIVLCVHCDAKRVSLEGYDLNTLPGKEKEIYFLVFMLDIIQFQSALVSHVQVGNALHDQ